MAAMAVAEAAHMHATFHSPDDSPASLHRGHADLEEERMTTGAEDRPVPGDDKQGDNHYTPQEPASSQVIIIIIIIITAVISISPYLTDKVEHTALCKINNNEYIKTSETINYIVIMLYSSHTAPAPARTQAH